MVYTTKLRSCGKTVLAHKSGDAKVYGNMTAAEKAATSNGGKAFQSAYSRKFFVEMPTINAPAIVAARMELP